MANDVSKPSKIQSAMVAAAAPVRTLVGGTPAMRAAAETYLPKEPMESQAAYQNRLKRSVLFNATGKTVADMTGKVFTKPIQLGKDVPDQLKEWAENIDNAGRHLNVFACDVFFDCLQSGIGFIFVDMPPAVQRADGAPATLADEQTAGIRPYMTFVPLERLIGWKSSTVAGAVKLTQIRIKECVSEQDPQNEFNELDVDQIRVVTTDGTTCTWQTYRQTKADEKAEWVAYQDGTMPLPDITLVPVYLNRTDFMQAAPPLAKLAELNIAHWQSASDQRNILHVARVPILFGAGIDAEAQLTIGAAEMIRVSNADAKLSYVEHTGAAIGAGDKDLQNLELQMAAMGLQLLIDGPGGQTATGEIRDDAKENSPLAMMATSLQDALEQAFDYMEQMAGIADTDDTAGNSDDEDKGGSITVNKDFGINGSTADLQYLTQAVLGGKLDNETYIDELQRRGVLSDSVDKETVLARIAAQAPELGTNIPPGGGMNLDPKKKTAA